MFAAVAAHANTAVETSERILKSLPRALFKDLTLNYVFLRSYQLRGSSIQAGRYIRFSDATLYSKLFTQSSHSALVFSHSSGNRNFDFLGRSTAASHLLSRTTSSLAGNPDIDELRGSSVIQPDGHQPLGIDKLWSAKLFHNLKCRGNFFRCYNQAAAPQWLDWDLVGVGVANWIVASAAARHDGNIAARKHGDDSCVHFLSMRCKPCSEGGSAVQGFADVAKGNHDV